MKIWWIGFSEDDAENNAPSAPDLTSRSENAIHLLSAKAVGFFRGSGVQPLTEHERTLNKHDPTASYGCSKHQCDHFAMANAAAATKTAATTTRIMRICRLVMSGSEGRVAGRVTSPLFSITLSTPS